MIRENCVYSDWVEKVANCSFVKVISVGSTSVLDRKSAAVFVVPATWAITKLQYIIAGIPKCCRDHFCLEKLGYSSIVCEHDYREGTTPHEVSKCNKCKVYGKKFLCINSHFCLCWIESF